MWSPESISTNNCLVGSTMEPTVQPNGHVCASCGWLSERKAKPKKLTSQRWARHGDSGGGPLSWHASFPAGGLRRISVTGSVRKVGLGFWADSGSFYTSPNASNVRTLNGHIKILLAKNPSQGHVAQWDFDMTVQCSDVRGVRAGVE